MPTPGFSMNAVLRSREVHRDQCRQQWAEARGVETAAESSLADLQERLQRVRNRLREAVAPGTLNVQELSALKALERSLREQLLDCQQRCRQAADHSDHQQTALADADRQVRVLKRLADRQQQEHERELAVREARELDDRLAST